MDERAVRDWEIDKRGKRDMGVGEKGNRDKIDLYI